MKHSFHIGWIAVQELAHEKVSYLLIGFALFALGMSMVLGQMTYAEQAKLTLDFMLGGTHLTMILFGIFMGISLFQRELALGSISMVLSKPISRASFLVGKFLGQIAVQFLLALMMGVLTCLFCLRFGTGAFSPGAVFQTVLMIGWESAIITACTYVFAVNSGAVVTSLGAACIFLLGHGREVVNSNLKETGELLAWNSVKTLIPDLEIFNMKSLASYAQMIEWNEFFLASIYGTVCVAFYLTVAVLFFSRRDIAT
jgi:ABC-type transport system involved in multi-copper enzyme maturation permease subunit